MFFVVVSAGGDSGVLLVFGQKAFCVSQLASEESCTSQLQTPHRLCCVTKVIEVSDWILDAVWLTYKDPSSFRIAFVTAHNAVLVYSVTDGSVSTITYHNEVNCILYPTGDLVLYSPLPCIGDTVLYYQAYLPTLMSFVNCVSKPHVQ